MSTPGTANGVKAFPGSRDSPICDERDNAGMVPVVSQNWTGSDGAEL